MGLDMYLFSKNDNGDVSNKLAYWRKANAIHNYFVSAVQNDNDDCGDYLVTESDLVTLKELCKDILEDRSLAEELLPTTEGFFFGSVEYNDGYFDNLQYTMDVCDQAINHIKNGNEVVYSSSW